MITVEVDHGQNVMRLAVPYSLQTLTIRVQDREVVMCSRGSHSDNLPRFYLVACLYKEFLNWIMAGQKPRPKDYIAQARL